MEAIVLKPCRFLLSSTIIPNDYNGTDSVGIRSQKEPVQSSANDKEQI